MWLPILDESLITILAILWWYRAAKKEQDLYCTLTSKIWRSIASNDQKSQNQLVNNSNNPKITTQRASGKKSLMMTRNWCNIFHSRHEKDNISLYVLGWFYHYSLRPLFSKNVLENPKILKLVLLCLSGAGLKKAVKSECCDRCLIQSFCQT